MLLAAPVSVELRFSVRLTSATYTYVRAFVKEKGDLHGMTPGTTRKTHSQKQPLHRQQPIK